MRDDIVASGVAWDCNVFLGLIESG